jgi:SAM-dependent methyltransferase
MNDHNLDPSQNDNELTLQSYQNKTKEYVEGTPPVDDAIKAWTDACLSLIPQTGKILEIGSGFGRDAEHIKERGFEIECTDAVPNFVEILKSKGLNARTLNLLTDPIEGEYDMVFADAVLLHFTPQEAAQVTRKIHTALNDKGIFALRVKKGDGAVWTDSKLGSPRYFYYWQPEELKEMLADCGFDWLDMAENYTSHNNADWMGVIARKIS